MFAGSSDVRQRVQRIMVHRGYKEASRMIVKGPYYIEKGADEKSRGSFHF